ncbi:hypothetical protein JNUCC42_13150 [Brevibacterium sp. JNUCC-42]|nr:hypothetical protein JNUCC42_13150 [Brevibacterium sp. JNUCC-42]
MITPYSLEEQAKHLQTLFATAEIEINGMMKPMPLTSVLEGKKVRFFIDVPASDTGTITRRIIKNVSDQICWIDPIGTFTINKPDVELRIEIPISLLWKEGI